MFFASFLLLDWIFFVIALVLLVPAILCVESFFYGWATTCMIASVGLATFVLWPQISALYAGNSITVFGVEAVAFWLLAGFITAFVYWVFYIWKAKERYETAIEDETPSTTVERLTQELVNKHERNVDRIQQIEKDAVKRDIPINIPTDYRFKLSEFPNVNPVFLAAFVKWERATNSLRSIYQASDSRGINIPETTDTDTLLGRCITDDPIDGVKVIMDDLKQILPPKFKSCRKVIVWSGIDWPITLLHIALYRLIKQVLDRAISACKSIFDGLSTLAFGKL